MKLYVVRHAEAVERSADIPEEQRYLTSKGRLSFRKTGRELRRKGVLPDLILTSPLARALQTADILAEALGYEGELVVTGELEPGFDLAALRRLAAAYGQCRKVAIVGHAPDLGLVTGALLRREGSFPLKKGAVVALEVDPADLGAPARFKWLVHDGGKPVKSLEDVGSE